jgi:hypothetical protein
MKAYRERKKAETVKHTSYKKIITFSSSNMIFLHSSPKNMNEFQSKTVTLVVDVYM